MSADTVFQSSPLERVCEGMAVLDSGGARVGKVKRFSMGDPQAVTTAGQTPAEARAATPVSGMQDAPSVPEPLRTTLLRVGFIELEDTKREGPDRYIAGDRIADVSGETVQLRADGTSWPQEGVHSHASTAGDAVPREPMLRTHLGSTSYAVKSRGPFNPNALWGATAGGLAIVGTGAAVGAWMYRRRRRRAQLQARIRTGTGGAGSALLVMLLIRIVASRLHNDTRRTEALADLSERAPRSMRVVSRQMPRARTRAVLAAAAVGAGVVWRLRARRQREPRYIGTPGVESAYGRDRVRSGELPPEYGVEHPHL